MKVWSLHFDCPTRGLGWLRLLAQTSRPWHRLCSYEYSRRQRGTASGINEQLGRKGMKMQNTAYWKRLRHIVLGAVAGGAWFLGVAPGLVLAGEADSVGGEPLPKERRQNETGAQSRRVDRAEDIIALLHEGNRMEIEGAKLALEKGQAERVKNYALLLTKEHQRCDKQLMDYADQKQLDRRSLDDGKEEATDGPLERLRVRQSQNFDRAFILAMVREHGKMIDALTITTQESRDADLRRLLAEQLPVLERLKKAGERILARLPANSEK
jgi:predicted outer membrane protein